MWLSLKPEDNILCLHHNTFVGSMRFGRCCSRKGLGSNPRRVFCVESLHVLSRPVWVFSRYSVIPSQYKDINQIRLINWWFNCRYKCERELSVFMCISPPTERRTVPESSPRLALLQLGWTSSSPWAWSGEAEETDILAHLCIPSISCSPGAPSCFWVTVLSFYFFFLIQTS